MRPFLLGVLSFLLISIILTDRMDLVWADDAGPTFELKAGESPETVRDAVRAWRAADSSRAQAPVRILVHEGTWFLADPFCLTTEDNNTSWEAQGQVVWTRGQTITGWRQDEQGRFVTQIPQVADGTSWFESLYVNGRRAVPARTPNTFYYYTQQIVQEIPDPETGGTRDVSLRAFVVRDSERPLFERLAESPSLHDIQLKFYFSWETSEARLESYDPATGTALLATPANLNNRFGSTPIRYTISGCQEALDMPGEFALDRNGTLTYLPCEGETLENTTFVAAFSRPDQTECGFLSLAGNTEELENRDKNQGDVQDSALYIQNVTWSGFTFEVDSYILPQKGLVSGQAAIQSPGAIVVSAARNVAFRDCTVRHIGGYAVWFRQACDGCRVERSLLEDLGAGGVRIGYGWSGADGTQGKCCRNCSVTDCIIRGYGKNDHGAVGLWIVNSPNNSLLHNEIYDGFYTGISIGWVWGYGPSLAKDNRAEFNHIHHFGKGVMSDMGGVYTLGISPGTVVSNNVIHDVCSYNRFGRGGWGLYTDEGSSQILFENNLVYRVHTGSVHQHYGQDNIFRNNIFAFSRDGQIQRSRNEEHLSFTMERNIILWDKSPLLANSWPDDSGRFNLNHNLYCHMGSQDTDEAKAGTFFAGRTLADWQAAGHDEGSLLADPGMMDPLANDFRFRDGKLNEAVSAIGFVPFDPQEAGLTPDARSRFEKVLTDYVIPEVVEAPDPPKAE